MPLLLSDLDDTALDRDAAFDRWARSFVATAGISEDVLPWMKMEDRSGRRDKIEFFTVVRDELGASSSVTDLLDSFRSQFPMCFRLDDAVLASLTRLRALGWTIAIVTNGSEHQQDKIDASGLGEVVDVVVISEIVGSRKPDAAIFEKAAQAARSTLEGAWMIGDSADADIAGAVQLGLSSVWLSRGRRWQHDDYAPTHIAESFAMGVTAILRDDG